MELKDILKTIIIDTVNGMDPLTVTFATVVQTDPLILEIQATQLRVEEPVAVLTDAVKQEELDIDGTVYRIREGLQKGDKVLALKANAGQNYIVLSKV